MVFRNKYVNRLRKRAGKVVKRVLKRRYLNKSTGALKLGQVIRDVASVKRMVNAEKKHLGPTGFLEPTSLTNVFPVGLTNGTGEGLQILNITPQLIKGDNRGNRQGNSVKLTSAYIHMNLAGQSAQANNSKIVIEVYSTQFRLYGSVPVVANLASDLFKQDPLTNRYSANCGRNPNYFKQFRCVGRKVLYTPQDNAGTSNYIRQIGMPLRINKHLRYDDSDTGNAWTNLEYFLVIRCNNGNASPTITTATGNAVMNGLNTAVNTGFQFQLYTDWYFYDN